MGISDTLSAEELNIIESTICWICFHYPDESARYFSTTLNEEILGPVLRNRPDRDYLYNLDKQRWETVRELEGVRVEVTTDEPKLEELVKFVNRFV